jgi:hypothetical protein
MIKSYAQPPPPARASSSQLIPGPLTSNFRLERTHWATHKASDLAAAAGVKLNIKGLRHYTASQLLAARFDLRNTAARLGHGSGGATTLRHYADPVSEVDRRAAAYLAQLTAGSVAQELVKFAAGDAPAPALTIVGVGKPFTGSTASCTERASCTDSTGHGSDSTRSAGIIRRVIPRTVPRRLQASPHGRDRT